MNKDKDSSFVISIDDIERYFDRLWPILRSITGAGVRETHDILAELVPLERIETPSGTNVLDWTVPKEWIVREAYVIDPHGNKILDVRENNLHLLNYSVPFKGDQTLEELDQHLYSLPDYPEAIPYVTSYYKSRWGFCISQNEREALKQGVYKVVIDTELVKGSMTLSEAILPGETNQEVLISTYTCHPSMANNELSGPLVAAFLYRKLASTQKRRLTYRFVFLPETIGAIAYLDMRGEELRESLVAGYVATCLGADSDFIYKRSREGKTSADRAAELVLERKYGKAANIKDYFPSGSDERQYCSPGFNLPVGSIMRTYYDTYPEYHTSKDNKEFISFSALKESIELYYEVCMTLDVNGRYLTNISKGEPQYSKRDLAKTFDELKKLQWVVNSSDGNHDLIDISGKSGFDIRSLYDTAEQCLQKGLISRI